MKAPLPIQNIPPRTGAGRALYAALTTVPMITDTDYTHWENYVMGTNINIDLTRTHTIHVALGPDGMGPGAMPGDYEAWCNFATARLRRSFEGVATVEVTIAPWGSGAQPWEAPEAAREVLTEAWADWLAGCEVLTEAWADWLAGCEA